MFKIIPLSILFIEVAQVFESGREGEPLKRAERFW